MTLAAKRPAKVYFIGAGPGAPELITVKGAAILKRASCVVYAGSLVSPAMLKYCRKGAVKVDSSGLDLNAFMDIIVKNAKAGKTVVRLSAGDPSLYGALMEQTAILEKNKIDYEVVPGISSAFASAAILRRELTVPTETQTVIFTRLKGRTPVPAREALSKLARHGSTICVFLSADKISSVVSELKKGGRSVDTPVAIVYRATWPDEIYFTATIGTVVKKMKSLRIKNQTMIIVGKAVSGAPKATSLLYDKKFTHGFRRGVK